MLQILIPLLALSAAAGGDTTRAAQDARDGISPAVRHRLERADAALSATGRIATQSLRSRELGERMHRLPSAPRPAEPVVRKFDYELLAKIAAENKLKREKRAASRALEPYRRPEPSYLSGAGVLASAVKKPSQREAIAKARQKLRQISLTRQRTLPRPST